VNLRWPLSPFLRREAGEEVIGRHHDTEAVVMGLEAVVLVAAAVEAAAMAVAMARGNSQILTEIHRIRVTVAAAAVVDTVVADPIAGVGIPVIKGHYLPS
jgi:hypothetical protein